MSIASLPAPPYYVVCFSSQRTDVEDGYGEIGVAMVELAKQQPGFLGFESARRADGFGIINSYWRNEEASEHGKPLSITLRRNAGAGQTGTRVMKSASPLFREPTDLKLMLSKWDDFRHRPAPAKHDRSSCSNFCCYYSC
ncbi:putative protein yqjZ (plasmid) [Rhizobium favelukesii]|uniref:ABM domain-containing protein n=1 Tax=Rhizobium favelukesii TaxID=348824 RepID=W6S3U3_9HYPH|nr:putative protein yqjZ [Rhizobium favelukesii]